MIEIFGKPGCPYCEKAKKLCESRLLAFNYYTLGVEYTKEELLEEFPGARTVPQIRIGSQIIGTYDNLVTYLEETGYTGTGYSL